MSLFSTEISILWPALIAGVLVVISHVPLGQQNPPEYVRNNCVVARRFAETCEAAGVERFAAAEKKRDARAVDVANRSRVEQAVRRLLRERLPDVERQPIPIRSPPRRVDVLARQGRRLRRWGRRLRSAGPSHRPPPAGPRARRWTGRRC